jgi:uncharacterized membrane protein
MESLIVIAVLGVTGLVIGLACLLWLRPRPHLKAWTRPALVVTVGSIVILGLGLLPPFTLWMILGHP